MKITIHNGASEIGGNCVELTSGDKSIFLDAGVSLEDLEDKAVKPFLVDFNEIKKTDKSEMLGIFLSHAHKDHFLSLKNTADIPVYTGKISLEILKVLRDFDMLEGIKLDNVKTFNDGEEFCIGPFRITPILVDHSIYDAHAFYITDGNSTVLYTGDIRFNGRKKYMMGKAFDDFKKPDVLLVEGTNIANEKKEDGYYESEESLEEPMTEFIKKTKGLCLIASSSPNIDRIVTIYKAARKAKRELIVDLYTAEILRATGNDKILNTSWPTVHLYLNEYQKNIVKKTKNFEMSERHKFGRIYDSEIYKNRDKYVLLYKKSDNDFLSSNNLFEDAAMIYSMWSGYIKKDESLQEIIEFYNMTIKHLHFSGHMFRDDLIDLVAKIGPKAVIPIHTNNKEMFGEIFNNAVLLENGQGYSV